jgi:hypothetical protein
MMFTGLRRTSRSSNLRRGPRGARQRMCRLQGATWENELLSCQLMTKAENMAGFGASGW